MGHSRAYPVFRTPDAHEAYARAKRLCALLERIEDEMWLGAEPRTEEEALRLAVVAPGLEIDEEPLSVAGWVPVGRFEAEFLRAVGGAPASMDWRGLWPDGGSQQYDGVQAVFNSDDPELTRTAPSHTVLIHLDKRCHPDRAAKLAALIGASVLGPPHIGW